MGIDDVAVVGAAFRLPGGVCDHDHLWRLLMQQVPSDLTISKVPQDRLWPQHQSAAERKAGWLHGIREFDPSAFNIPLADAQYVRPNTRLMLECTLEALEHAAIPVDSLSGTDAAVYIGAKPDDNFDKMLYELEGASTYNRHYLAGVPHGSISGRISHWLDTRGPSMTIDCACASSSASIAQGKTSSLLLQHI